MGSQRGKRETRRVWCPQIKWFQGGRKDQLCLRLLRGQDESWELTTGFSSVETTGELIKGSSMEQWCLKSGGVRTEWEGRVWNADSYSMSCAIQVSWGIGQEMEEMVGTRDFWWKLLLYICGGEQWSGKRNKTIVYCWEGIKRRGLHYTWCFTCQEMGKIWQKKLSGR